jgi:hypothetical protein
VIDVVDRDVESDTTSEEVDVDSDVMLLDKEVSCEILVLISFDKPVLNEITPIDVEVDKDLILLDRDEPVVEVDVDNDIILEDRDIILNASCD